MTKGAINSTRTISGVKNTKTLNPIIQKNKPFINVDESDLLLSIAKRNTISIACNDMSGIRSRIVVNNTSILPNSSGVK